MPKRRERTKSEQLFSFAVLPAEFALVGGAWAAAAAHSRTGLFVMVTGFLCLLLVHLFLGIHSYHRSMTREWPRVRPLDDWDDD